MRKKRRRLGWRVSCASRAKRSKVAPWSELIGRFLRLDVYESDVSLVLSCGREHVVLSFPKEGLESQTLQRELASCKPGTKIVLIKADEALMPLLVRIIGT